MSLQITDSLVTLASANLEKLVNFYTDLLSQKPIKYIPNVYAEFRLPGIKLGIFKPKPTHEAEFANVTQSKMSLCLEVKNLENAIAHLTDLGYPPNGEITTASHGQEIYIYDIDGNRIILHQGK
jgi:catechol 2,3-dioxygenase-like lactoylglutathione lyase family enzyme